MLAIHPGQTESSVFAYYPLSLCDAISSEPCKGVLIRCSQMMASLQTTSHIRVPRGIKPHGPRGTRSRNPWSLCHSLVSSHKYSKVPIYDPTCIKKTNFPQYNYQSALFATITITAIALQFITSQHTV